MQPLRQSGRGRLPLATDLSRQRYFIFKCSVFTSSLRYNIARQFFTLVSLSTVVLPTILSAPVFCVGLATSSTLRWKRGRTCPGDPRDVIWAYPAACNLGGLRQKKIGHHLEKAHIDSRMCSGLLGATRTRIQPVIRPSRHFAHSVTRYSVVSSQ